jgi:hypothetical protein
MVISFEDISATADIITALAAVTTVYLAYLGVSAWKNQIRGKTDYEIARKYLKATLKLRDAILYVRQPFIDLAEMERAAKEQGVENDRKNRAVYASRWKKITEANTELEVELLEAQVSWGDEALRVSDDLMLLVRKLNTQLQFALTDVLSEHADRNIIYNHGSLDDPDDFSKEVIIATQKIRDYLKPHLL